VSDLLGWLTAVCYPLSGYATVESYVERKRKFIHDRGKAFGARRKGYTDFQSTVRPSSENDGPLGGSELT
jgi:hypothetical protein